jgi:acetoin utilization protein AcuB
MYVGRRMTPNPITATPDTSHAQAFKIMRDHGVRHLPVMDHNKLVGIVVEQDLLRAEPSSATTLSIHEIYSLLDQLKLRDIMVRPVITVGKDCPLEEAARILRQYRITGLPVMRDGALVGIITEMDIFDAFIEVLGGEEEGLVFTVKLEDKPGALATVTRAVAAAGGNIISLVTFQSTEEGSGEVYIKLDPGADQEQLETLIREEAAADLLSIAPITQYEPALFGQKK